MTTRTRWILATVLISAAVIACKGQGPSTEPTGPAAEPSAAASSTASTPPVEAEKKAPPPSAPAGSELAIKWEAPASWLSVPPKNSMRQASYQIPAAAGDTEGAELNVFYFGPRRPGAGDPVEANVERWLAQFSGVLPEQVVRGTDEINSLKQHTVEIKSGTFSSGGMMMGAPPTEKPKFALLGAIVESAKGDYFFKLTGPAATVAGAKADFLAFLKSVKPNP